MGIQGAAIATLISQLFNLVIIVIEFVLCIRKDGDRPILSLHFKKITIRDYLIMILPILISEFLWSLGQNVESAVYGHLGTSNLAAYTLTGPIQGLIVFTLYAPVKVENMILGGGIIRSGGNTKIIMIIDIVGTWCIGIPLCLLAAYVFKWGIVGVYTLLTTEELFRLAVSLIIFRRRKWIISLC